MDLLALVREVARVIGEQHRFGMFRGVVTNVDDPEGLGRIKATVHELLGETDEPDWALPDEGELIGGHSSAASCGHRWSTTEPVRHHRRGRGP